MKACVPKIYELFLRNSPISSSTLPLRYRKSNANIPLEEVRYPNYSAISISFLGKKIKSDVANKQIYWGENARTGMALFNVS